MLSSLRTTLLIFLAILQFIAPLVHAHAGHESTEFGLHVPGLETFTAADEPLVFETAHCYSCSADFIFSVNDGIKLNRSHTDNPSQFYLRQHDFGVIAKIARTDTDSFPRITPFISRFQPSSLSTRAPPIL